MAAAPLLENFMRKLLAPEIFYLDSATFTERGSLTQQVDTIGIISTSYLNKIIPDEFRSRQLFAPVSGQSTVDNTRPVVVSSCTEHDRSRPVLKTI